MPAELARRTAGMPSMLALFDIVEVAVATEHDAEDVLRVYFRLGSRLELNWLRDRIIELPRANRWQALARAALRDDLFNLYRELTREVLDAGGAHGGGEAAIDAWSERNAAAARAVAGDGGRRQGVADLRHDDAAGGAARGPRPAPWDDEGGGADGWARSRWPSSAARRRPPPQIGHKQQADVDRAGDAGTRPVRSRAGLQSVKARAQAIVSARTVRQPWPTASKPTSPSCPSRACASRRRSPPRRSSGASSRPRGSSAARCACPDSARARCRRRS